MPCLPCRRLNLRVRIVSSRYHILQVLHRDQETLLSSLSQLCQPVLETISSLCLSFTVLCPFLCLWSNSGPPSKSFLSTRASHLVTPFPFHLKTFTTFSHTGPSGGFVILACMPVSNIYSPPPDSEEATSEVPWCLLWKNLLIMLSPFPALVLSAFDPADHAD